MIVVNELRIGSAIEFNFKVTKWAKVEMSINDFKHIEKHKELYRPIPLTEEKLLEAGFEYYGDLFDCILYRKGIIMVSILKGIYTFSIKRDAKSSYFPITEFLYVHQLQNLYLDIEKKELTFKLAAPTT